LIGQDSNLLGHFNGDWQPTSFPLVIQSVSSSHAADQHWFFLMVEQPEKRPLNSHGLLVIHDQRMKFAPKG
jgi:hypothetical protein